MNIRSACAMITNMNITLHPDGGPAMQELLEAFTDEARPFVTQHRKGRIVVSFSGGDHIHIETARFRDLEPVKEMPR